MTSFVLLNAASAVNFFVTSRLPYKKATATTSFSVIKIWALKTEENLEVVVLNTHSSINGGETGRLG